MRPSCLFVSLQPDAERIAILLRNIGLDVVEKCDCCAAIDAVAAHNWAAVVVESHLQQQTGWSIVWILKGIRIFPPKFFLLCDNRHSVPHEKLRGYGVTDVLPRPLHDATALKEILHVHGVV